MVLAHNVNEGLRTQDIHITEDVTFDTMLLTPNTLEGLTNSGFYKPSPIQLHGIPLGKCGFDLVLEAKSGTGKTAVFTTIALEKLNIKKGLQTIILAPTREIAAQIADVIKQLGSSFKNLEVEVVIGGLPTQEDISKFTKNVHIVVGSPGRLRYLIQNNHVDVSSVRLFVLDEADKLLDKSFLADINYIYSVLPKDKQVIMSSATYPEALKSLLNKYVHNAQHICPDSTSILLGIKQLVVTVKYNSNIVRQTQNRFEELLKILSKKQFKQCFIFCNYQVRVRDLCKMLLHHKWPAEQLHGQQEQTDRLDALKTIQAYKSRILVSTDLAARGIDASNVDLVINFEPPNEWQTYLHRIGRAGRFGSYGIAITILSEGNEELKFKTTIKTISNSLVLNNLWDEEQFNPESDTSTETSALHEIQNNDDITKLLHKLTYGDANGEFKIINEPLEESTSKIESFDELLGSFESHKVNIVTTNCNKSDEDNLFNTTFKLETNVLSKHNKELEDSLKTLKNKIDMLNVSQIHNEETVTFKSNKYKDPFTHNTINYKMPRDMKSDNKVDNDDLRYEDVDTYKTFMDLGLPTAFGSTKNKRNNKKKWTTVKPVENELNSSKQAFTKQKEIEDSSKHFETDRKYKKHSHNKSETQLKLSVKHKQPAEMNTVNMKELQNDEERFISKNHNSIRKHIQNKELKMDGIYNPGNKYNYNRYENYAVWYDQLKFQMNQIQMAIYIDEISKM